MAKKKTKQQKAKEQDAEKKHAAERENKRTREKALLDAADKVGYDRAMALLTGVKD